MPDEARSRRTSIVLLVGDTASAPDAPAERMRDAGWRVRQVSDVYAAAVRLLRPDPSGVVALILSVESLRGDELRFLDLVARRWPTLPVAVIHAGTAEDRRIEACRRRGVPVMPAEAVADWLDQLQPEDSVVEPLPAEPDELPQPDEAGDLGESEDTDGLDESEEALPPEVPLAPWSGKPRAVRQGPHKPAVSPQPAIAAGPGASDSGGGAAEDGRSAQERLLTPEELKALLEESPGTDGSTEELA